MDMGKKILIVDDDKEIRRSTSEVLEKEGYSVQLAPSIDGAWETLQQWHPDLLLLDILLPSGKLKGFVKKVDDMQAINILYLSAFKESEADQLGLLKLSEKVKGYVEKPFSISTLLKKVKKALE